MSVHGSIPGGGQRVMALNSPVVSSPQAGARRRHEVVVVVGGGPAGLGVAGALTRRGTHPLLIERALSIVPRWKATYDSLELNTTKRFSHLPGCPFPRRTSKHPSRAEMVAYYESYARMYGIRALCATTVSRIERIEMGWRVLTTRGEIGAHQVVLASGKDAVEQLPRWPGSESFQGQLLHAAAYRNPRTVLGRRVIVVGAGNSAADIALELLGAGRAVTLALRRPPHIVSESMFGISSDLVGIAASRLPPALVDVGARALSRVRRGDLSRYGLPLPDDGLSQRMSQDHRIPLVDDGSFVEAVRSGALKLTGPIASLDAAGARLIDGRHVEADAIVAATGYRPGLEPLIGHLGILDSDGRPQFHGSRCHPSAPGLYVLGFTSPLSGNLRQIRRDAVAIAKEIQRRVHSQGGLRPSRHRSPAGDPGGWSQRQPDGDQPVTFQV